MSREEKVSKTNKTIYLHVGHPKTASTSLQRFLAKNRASLEIHGYVYPLMPNDSINHYTLFLSCKNSPQEILHSGLEQKTIDQAKLLTDLLSQHLASLSYDQIILSHESLIFNADELLKYFSKYDVKIIIYVRRLDHYVESFYSELVGHGSEHSTIDDHLKNRLERTYMRHYHMIDKLAESLGKNNVIVRPFEKEQWKNQCIIEDFLSAIGIEEVAMFDKNHPNLNLSLSTAQVCFLQKLNQAFYDRNSPSMMASVGAHLKPLLQSKAKGKKVGSLLSYEQRLMLIEKSNPFDQKIAREYLNREDGVLFYEKMPEAENAAASDMLSTQEIVELMADFLLAYPPDLPNRQAQSIQNFYNALMEKVKVLEGEC